MACFCADVPLRTYSLSPGFVTEIHKDSVRRWNLWFPSAGVFAEVLAGRATGTQITSPPQKKSLPVIDKHVQCVISNGTDTVSWKFRWLGKFVGETRCCPMQRHVVHEDSELEVDRVGSMQLMSLWSPHVDY